MVGACASEDVQVRSQGDASSKRLLGMATMMKVESVAKPAPGRVLLVEDDVELAEDVRGELVDRGYEVQLATTGPEGARRATSNAFDLLVIDRMLPELDGLSLVAQLRETDLATPVLIISALADVDERIRGLRAGGDDYLTKPFALGELCARVEALLRRPLQTRAMALRVGPLTLDLIDRVARRGDRVIELLPREFRLLEYLMRRPGQLVTRAMLLEGVWHYRFIPETNLVDVHIGKLRRKIDDEREPSLIQAVRGQGFMFRAED
jgi:two-component system OmpR family response regulator